MFDSRFKRTRQARIQTYLKILVLSCLVPVCLSSIYLVHYSYRNQLRFLEENSLDSANILAIALDRDMSIGLAALRALATSPVLASGDLAAFHAQALRLLKDFQDSDIILADATGQQLVNSYKPFNSILPKRGSLETVDRIFKTGKPCISNIFKGAVTGRYLLGIDVPVFQNGQVRFDLGMTLPVNRLLPLLHNEPTDGWLITILDRNNTVAARSRSPEAFIGKRIESESLLQSMAESTHGTTEGYNMEGVFSTVSFWRSEMTGWTVLVSSPRVIMLDTLRKWLIWTVAGLCALLIFGLGMAMVITRIITRSVQALIAPAMALGQGEAVMPGQFELAETNEVAKALVLAGDLLKEKETARTQAENELQELNNTLEKRVSQRTAELQESQQRLVGVLESMPDAFVSFDRNLRYTYVNQNAETLQTARRDDLLGKDVREVYPDPESYKTIRLFEKVMAEGTPVTAVSYHAGFDQWVEVRAFSTPDGVSVFYKDVTDKIKGEAALRTSEGKYRNLFDNMTEEVHFWQLVRDEAGQIKTWRLIDANPPAIRTWGRSSVEEVRGKTTDEIFGPGATEHYMSVVQKIFTENAPYAFEDYFPPLKKHFRFTSVPLGEYFITTGADITNIKKIEVALRESEERLRLLGDNLPESAVYQYTYEPDDIPRFLYFSAGVERLNGISVAEVLSDASILHRQILPEHFERLLAAEAKSKREMSDFEMEVPMRRPDGEVRWMRLHSRPRQVPGNGLVWDGVQIDITDHKQAEEFLQKNAARLAVVLETQRQIGGADLAYAPFLQFVLDRISHLTGADGACLEIAEAEEMVCEAATGLAAGFEGMHMKLEGSLSGLCLCSDEVKRADDTETDHRVDRETCRRIGTRSMIVIPLRYDQHSFGVLNVFSRRVRAFDEDAEQKLRMMLEFLGATVARKRDQELLKASLAEKEVMLKEIHHRVKNNLQIISSLINMQADTLTNDQIREELGDVSDRIRSMALVHEQLYQTDNLAQIDLANYSKSMLRALWRSHGILTDKIRLNLVATPLAVPIEKAIPCGLILNELAINALKYAFPNGKDGEVTVDLQFDSATNRVSLRVSDNGIGLPVGLDWRQSPSLGLHLVQILAKQLRGTVETVDGNRCGAEFQVTFPLDTQS